MCQAETIDNKKEKDQAYLYSDVFYPDYRNTIKEGDFIIIDYYEAPLYIYKKDKKLHVKTCERKIISKGGQFKLPKEFKRYEGETLEDIKNRIDGFDKFKMQLME